MHTALAIAVALSCLALHPKRLQFMLAAARGDLGLVKRMLPVAKQASVEMAIKAAAMEDADSVVNHILHVQGYRKLNHFIHKSVLQIAVDFDSPRVLHSLLDGRLQFSRGELVDALAWCEDDAKLCKQMLEDAIGDINK